MIRSRRYAARLALLLAAISLFAGAVVRAQAAGIEAELSARERTRLARGDLVTRRDARQQGPLELIGGTSFQVVDIPVGATWRALRDVARFHRMLPGASSCSPTYQRGNQYGVRLTHRHGLMELSYQLRLSYVADTRVVMFQVDDHNRGSIRGGWGFIRVQEWPENKTLVTFGVMADPGNDLMTDSLRPQVHAWILRVPETMKRWLEGRGRERYASR